ncbi:MAG TPA: 50S ribosomal protein L22 [Bacillota bacterium]|nr:50S ribosomal protein L22 [Bacillota bacterium]HPF41996.1 50S ribosomal protein L22 [Bacillota bacterium]HPJ85930.1 50S ribosomal protein L22 [Bacillota bacterium]HPQ61824.1 50S ribosomal protein L22 [Bacillota bacterium]HRX91199.1 50S ribosomal protein L22 [Candidatus Izemoplasmatales bacterium]
MEAKEAKAVLRSVRIAPRKVRLVVDLVRGQSINDAYAILRNLQRGASKPVEKLIKSAAANADHNFQLDPEKLYIKEIFVGEGKTFKRIQPRSRGRAFAILKRTSHIYVTVAERE